MTNYSIFLVFALFSLTIISHIESSKTNGFSVDLIHRDSPKSPFYNPSETHSSSVRDALQRSLHRVHRFTRTNNSVSPDTAVVDLLLAGGEYLMSLSIGTPAFDIFALADTGSDLIWTQCKPCINCFEQKAPIFDPKNSSTYRQVSCATATCTSAGGGSSCSETDNSCQYSIHYGSQSSSNGVVAVETLTLGSTSARSVQVPNTVFGCGFDQEGGFNEGWSGIIGLGGGQVSLISQMEPTINGKFSYCLFPLNAKGDNTSKMNFGSKGIVSGNGVVSTPLVRKDSARSFYYLTLEAICVGDERVEFSESSKDNDMEEGNIIIDSGTTLTLLPSDFFDRLKTVVAAQVKAPQITDPGQFLGLCFESVTDLKVPNMTVHFSGAIVVLNMYNAFVRVSDSVVCFAFAPSDNISIYGNLAQLNFLIGYDVQKGTVSFKPADCTQN